MCEGFHAKYSGKDCVFEVISNIGEGYQAKSRGKKIYAGGYLPSWIKISDQVLKNKLCA